MLELLDAGDHRVIPVEDNLVIKTFNDVFYGIVIDQYAGIIVNSTVDPYLDFPPVPVEIGAFSLVMEQSVTCIKVHLFVYTGFITRNWPEWDIILLAMRSNIYKQVGDSTIYKSVPRVCIYLSESYPSHKIKSMRVFHGTGKICSKKTETFGK